MTGQDLTLRIKTTADTAAVAKTEKAVADLGKAAESTDKKTVAAGKGGIDAAKGFATLGQTAAASSGSIGGLASALGGMAQQLPALAGMAGPIGLAVAAFMAWKSAIDAVIDSQASLDKGLRDTAAGNVEAGVRSLIRYYNDLQKAIANAADEARMYADAEASKDDAQTKADLAALELDRSRRLASLAPGDTLGARAIDLDAAERRASIEDAAAKRRSDRELAALRAQESVSFAAMNAAQVQRGELEGRFSELGGQYAHLNQKAANAKPLPWVFTEQGKAKAKEKAYEKAGPELERIAAAMEKVAEEIRAATDTVAKEQRAQYGLSQQAEINLIGRGTLASQQQAGGFQRSAASASLSRDVAAAREAAQAEAQASRQAQAGAGLSRAEAQRGVLSAEANLRNARNARGGGQDTEALKRELDAARAARDEANRAFLDFARTSKDKDKQLAEALRNLPNN